MIDEFAKLFELTIRELRYAAVRIERQSWLVLKTRLRIRRACKRLRKLRRRVGKIRSRSPDSSGPPCDYEPRTFGKRLYWVCSRCEQTALRPVSARKQRELGVSCPGRERCDDAAYGN